MCMSSSSEAKPASPSSPANNSSGNVSRDPSWLKLDVCPEYMEQSCLRNEEDCPLAHPSSSINTVEGTVTCCFDFIKDRCQRTSCRYYHPPPLIKEQLVVAGKMHAQSKSRSKDLSAFAPDFHVYGPNEGTPFSPLLPYSLPYCEKVEVCREFMRRRCHRTVHECRFYHPEHHTAVDPQNMVVVCPNIATAGACKMTRCPYAHPLSQHKLQRVMLNPFPSYAMNNNYMQPHQTAMAAPYHPMLFSSYHYPPNMMYPGSMPSSLYSNQFAQVMPTSYRPYPSSTLWTPPSGVFFGADYVSGTDLQSPANGFSAETEDKTIKMGEWSRKHPIEHMDNQN